MMNFEYGFGAISNILV